MPITRADSHDRGATPDLWATNWMQVEVPRDYAGLTRLDAHARTQLAIPGLPAHRATHYRCVLTAIRNEVDTVAR